MRSNENGVGVGSLTNGGWQAGLAREMFFADKERERVDSPLHLKDMVDAIKIRRIRPPTPLSGLLRDKWREKDPTAVFSLCLSVWEETDLCAVNDLMGKYCLDYEKTKRHREQCCDCPEETYK